MFKVTLPVCNRVKIAHKHKRHLASDGRVGQHTCYGLKILGMLIHSNINSTLI